jgi:hypothetical protein
MGTIANLAVSPDRLVVDLYVGAKLLGTAMRWCTKRLRVRVDHLSTGVRVGDGTLNIDYRRTERKDDPQDQSAA